ncbi:hypothetical protein T190820D02B_20345 [Tenacibaculum sp. 190524A05c]
MKNRFFCSFASEFKNEDNFSMKKNKLFPHKLYSKQRNHN